MSGFLLLWEKGWGESRGVYRMGLLKFQGWVDLTPPTTYCLSGLFDFGGIFGFLHSVRKDLPCSVRWPCSIVADIPGGWDWHHSFSWLFVMSPNWGCNEKKMTGKSLSQTEIYQHGTLGKALAGVWCFLLIWPWACYYAPWPQFPQWKNKGVGLIGLLSFF